MRTVRRVSQQLNTAKSASLEAVARTFAKEKQAQLTYFQAGFNFSQYTSWRQRRDELKSDRNKPIYLRSPARYGFQDNLKDLPEPEVLLHEIEATPEQVAIAQRAPGEDGQLRLFRGEKLGITSRNQLSQAAKGFLYTDGRAHYQTVSSNKPPFVAQLIRDEIKAGHQVLVWTVFDRESGILAELLRDVPGLEVLTGATSQENRIRIIERFRAGLIPGLITRASILGHGLNFQNVTSMVFSGFDDSFERFYQAVRRAYRYGQTRRVRIHVPFIKELEGLVWNNLQEKQAAWDRDTEIMERYYIEAMRMAA